MNYFNSEAILKQLEKVKNSPPFKPEKYEMRYTCSQLFETGIEVTLEYVMRDGKMLIYNSYEIDKTCK